MANWYVRTSAAGSANGTNWTNAWSMANLNANWSKVAAGDTVWLAGGNYATAIVPGKSGTSGNPISVKRVLASDSVPVAAPGWNASFDSLVTISGGVPINYVGNSNGSWMIYDGRVKYGIKLVAADGGYEAGGAISFNGYGINNVQLRNCELAGPGGNVNYGSNLALFNMTWNGGGANTNNITASDCSMHGAPNILRIRDCNNIVVEGCTMYDNNAGNPSSIHPNFADINGVSEFTFRRNDVSGWIVEGFMMWGSVKNVYVYGNIWHDAVPGVNSCFWPSGTGATSQGPIFIVNNTFVECSVTNGQGNTVAFASGSLVRNNLYYNAGWSGNQKPSDIDYEMSNGSTGGGSHSVANIPDPFVNRAGKDYHISSTVAANKPKDKGVAVANPSGHTYNLDRDGNTRGADGSWDIGAYEVKGGVQPPTSVAVPTATPASGPYFASQNVALACATAGATIKYTKDGTDPTGSSPQYSAPIAVAAPMTVKAISEKSGMTTSAVGAFSYEVGSWTTGSTWKTVAVPQQSGKYKWLFSATLTGSSTDSAVGLGPIGVSGFSDMAVIVGFSAEGNVVAINGGAAGNPAYAAENVFPCVAGTKYDFVATVDEGAKTWSLTAGGVTIAKDYAFRVEQASAVNLDNLGMYSPGGTIMVEKVSFEPAAAPPQPNPPLQISDIEGLQAALDKKSDKGHTHDVPASKTSG